MRSSYYTMNRGTIFASSTAPSFSSSIRSASVTLSQPALRVTGTSNGLRFRWDKPVKLFKSIIGLKSR
jgi:hypothetical protein